MASQSREVAAYYWTLLFLVIVLSFPSGSFATNDDNNLSNKRLRGALPSFDSNNVMLSNHQRNLSKQSSTKKSKKSKGSSSKSTAGSKTKASSPEASTSSSPAEDRRMIVRCPSDVSDENCLKELSTMGENLNVIHSLSMLHSFAVEAEDVSTFDNLKGMGVDVVQDVERLPLDDADYYSSSASSMTKQYQPQYRRRLGEDEDGDSEESDDGEVIPNGVDLIHAPEVWEQYGVNGEGVTICVLDTGVDATHPDLQQGSLSGYTGDEFQQPWNQTTRGHGTRVSGIIVANKDNEEGVIGVAPGATVYMVHVTRIGGRVFSSDILAAIEVCRRDVVDADIISISLGGGSKSQEEEDAFDKLREDGILTVAASGNTGGSDSIYPAAYGSVLSVAASDLDENLWHSSTINSYTDIAAPGVNIQTTDLNGQYKSCTGTSFAAPHVAGVAALLLDFDPTLSGEDIRNLVLGSTRSSSQQAITGIGIVDALSALEVLDKDGVPSPPSAGNECVETELSIETDQRGSDTAYRLLNDQDGSIIWIGYNLANNRRYDETACLDPTGCYRFDVVDRSGDGIQGEGINLTYDGTLEFSGGNFGQGGYVFLGNC